MIKYEPFVFCVCISVDVFCLWYFQLGFDVIDELMQKRDNSKIIVSSYVKSGVHCKETLSNLLVGLQSTGADIVKVVTEVAYITDVAPVFHVLTHSQV